MIDTYLNNFDDLSRRLKRQDEAAYIELFDLHYRYLHTVAVNYVLDCDIANDMVQETLIHLFNNIEKLEEIRNFKSYLRASVRNRCISYLRQLDIEDAHKSLYLREIQLIGTEDTEEEDLSPFLNELIDSLPDSCKQVCKLRFLDGYKINEISEQLSLSPNTIKVQIHRGKQKIKNDMLKSSELYKRLARCIRLFFY
ncbi:ECF RNA polymerase sigma factor SigW [bioreactor metagenome]|uniref:ECF RNA polymerase sigma factor SigW n=1 Tax=bioreactor metagenome TaxID=1076179 RepID=A0A645GJA5_9ZZZZ|nr:sigma-70 family RNA polymerase sigma factor [Rikenellaceae bacterium]